MFPRLRVAVFFAILALLVGLVATWWNIRGRTAKTASVDRVSLLDADYPEAKLYASASQEELIQLANAEVGSLLKRFPSTPAALNVQANRDFLLSDMVDAEKTWKAVLAIDPYNADALFGLANLAFQAGKYADAIALCEGLQRTNPGNPRVPLLLADAFLNSGKADLALLALEQHIMTEPTSVQALQMLGTAHLNCQNYSQAIEWFTAALKYAPDSKDAYYGLGQAYARLGDRAQAEQAMQRFSQLAEASGQSNALDAQAFEDREQAAHVAAQVYLDSALVYKSAGELLAAQDRILKALRLQPDVVAWLEELQRVLQLQGLRQPAIDVGQRLVLLLPQDAHHWLTLGGLYAELEQPEPAIEAFRKAIALAPEDPDCQAAKSIIEQLN